MLLSSGGTKDIGHTICVNNSCRVLNLCEKRPRSERAKTYVYTIPSSDHVNLKIIDDTSDDIPVCIWKDTNRGLELCKEKESIALPSQHDIDFPRKLFILITPQCSNDE